MDLGKLGESVRLVSRSFSQIDSFLETHFFPDYREEQGRKPAVNVVGTNSALAPQKMSFFGRGSCNKMIVNEPLIFYALIACFYKDITLNHKLLKHATVFNLFLALMIIVSSQALE